MIDRFWGLQLLAMSSLFMTFRYMAGGDRWALNLHKNTGGSTSQVNMAIFNCRFCYLWFNGAMMLIAVAGESNPTNPIGDFPNTWWMDVFFCCCTCYRVQLKIVRLLALLGLQNQGKLAEDFQLASVSIHFIKLWVRRGKSKLISIGKCTTPKLNSSPLKNDGWKTTLLLGCQGAICNFQGVVLEASPLEEWGFFVLPCGRQKKYMKTWNILSQTYMSSATKCWHRI